MAAAATTAWHAIPAKSKHVANKAKSLFLHGRREPSPAARKASAGIGSQSKRSAPPSRQTTECARAAVDPVVPIVSIDAAGEPSPGGVSDAGFTVHVGANEGFGETEQASNTAPLNPYSEAT